MAFYSEVRNNGAIIRNLVRGQRAEVPKARGERSRTRWRIMAGLFVALSIGFYFDGCKLRPFMEAPRAWCKKKRD